MMKSLSLAVVAASVVAFAQAAPAALTDVEILQFALTLEHLENAFYSGGLAKFPASQFASADERALFEEIAGHEATHVEFLTTALGPSAVKPCNYSFPYTDIAGFKSLAMVLEGVGVTAYLGAAGSITNKDYLTAAGSILTTEARHAAYIADVNGQVPWSGAFDTPLAPNFVYTLAAGFITSCPSENAPLPLKAFPALTAANASISSGSSLTLTVPPSVNHTDGLYVAFLTGVSKVFVSYQLNQSITIPTSIEATSTIYAVLTTSANSTADADVVAGPAILAFTGGAASGSGSGNSSGSGSGASSTPTNAAAGSPAALNARSTIVGAGWLGFAAVVALLL